MDSVTSDESDVEGSAGGNNRTVTYQASSPDEVRLRYTNLLQLLGFTLRCLLDVTREISCVS